MRISVKALTAAFLQAALLAGAATPALAADKADRKEANAICRELKTFEGIRCTKVERAAIADLVSVFRGMPAPRDDLEVETRHHQFENMLRVIMPRRGQ